MKAADPFPHIARHIVQAVAGGGVASHRLAVGFIAARTVIELGPIRCAVFTDRILAPPAVQSPLQPAAGGLLPLGLRGQARPAPSAVV